MGQRTRDKLLDEYEREIRAAMARTLWVMAYSDFVENNATVGYPSPGPGGRWEDVAPPTPQGAHRAARDLAELFGASEGVGRRRPMTTLFELAMHAHTGQPLEFSDIVGTHLGERSETTLEFGSDMVMEALGTGVSWFDDHEEFELNVPSFECRYDPPNLYWDGKVHSGRIDKPGKRAAGNFTTHSFDYTGFVSDGFQRVLAGLGIKVKPGEKRRIGGQRGGAEELGFRVAPVIGWYWKGKDIEVITQRDPITGIDPRTQNTIKDNAGRIGLRGSPKQVQKAVDLIAEFKNTGYQQPAGGRPDLSYINFGSAEPEDLRKNASPCTPEYHAELMADPVRWSQLESPGNQPLKKGGVLELRHCDRCHSTLSIKRMGPPPGVPMRNGEAQRWRVWDSVARDSYVDVTATSYMDAMRRGAGQLKALHHGETIELNAMPMEGETATGTRQPYTELVQIDRSGRMTITPAPDQLRQAHRKRRH